MSTQHESRKWWALQVAVFAAVHAGYYAAGVRFDRAALIEVMHFLDPVLLRERLLESIWYLHIQPPLMNLVTGLILKVTPESPLLFQAFFLGFGFLLYRTSFQLMGILGMRPGLSLVVATAFMASPAFILWEHFLLYTMPVAALVAFAAVQLYRLVDTRNARHAWLFFGTLFVLCATRSMFHIGFMVVVAGVVLIALRRDWRTVAPAALVPLVMLTGVHVKNGVLFGEYNVCSFSEKNLWIMTAGNIGWDQKAELVEEGAISELSLVNRWASLDAYPDRFKEVPPRFENIPALAATHKSNGAVNYNHYGNIAISNQYGEDAKVVLLRYPQAFVAATALSWYRYFQPASAPPVSPQNKACMQPMLRIYDHLVFWKLPVETERLGGFITRAGHPPYPALLILLPLAIGFGLYRVVVPGTLSPAQRGLILFACTIIGMVAVLGCSLDFLETARYRFTTDALSLALLARLAVERLRFCATPS
jgi:hypothetical protein